MTNFHPNLQLIEPAYAPDHLSESTLRALTRRMNRKLAWGPIKTLVLGLLTGGLLPLIWLPKRFGDFVAVERAQLWHFAEWMRLRFPGVESDRLQQSADAMRFRRSFWVGSIALAALAVTWAWTDLATAADRPITPKILWQFTARLPQVIKTFTSVPRVFIAAGGFALLLVAAHLLSLWQVVRHKLDVRKFVEAYNAAAKKHGLEPLDAPPQWEIRLDWLAGAAATLVIGALWGAPMMLAAGAQERYINSGGRALRLALAGRVFNELASRRPPIDLLLPAALAGRCAAEKCNAKMRAGAAYCVVCGARAVARSVG